MNSSTKISFAHRRFHESKMIHCNAISTNDSFHLCCSWLRIKTTLSLLALVTVVQADEIASVPVENPLPVYFEARSPAARSQIGGRGLRLAVIDGQPSGTLHAYCYDREERASKWISVDNGLTWTQSKDEAVTVPSLTRPVDFRNPSNKQSAEFLEADERDAHLIVLNDGRLLCTFARHTFPNGIFAIISSERGDTWDTDNPIYLAGSHPEFFGMPISLELDDGSILTAHSIRAYRQSSPDNPDGDSVAHVVRWRLPGDTHAPAAPHEGPLLTDPYTWHKYHNAGTGFTGNLQQIAYWKKSRTKRVHLTSPHSLFQSE